ncbi:MAG: hypothetical protein HKN82_12900 [Akkermansiaceae bacterium]|nr:hypothetical protein [Akkermansiaceae bacterium]
MKVVTRSILVLAILWAVLLALLFVFATPLAELLWILYPVLHWGAVVAGVLVFGAGAVVVIRHRWSGIGIMAITALGLSFFFTAGFELGRDALFQLRKPRYERLLADAIRDGDVPGAEGYIDAGPPVRYAFYWQRGVIDNWVAVVYDPTGLVMSVNQAEGWHDLHDPRWSEAVRLFGGDLYKCEKLEGHWYICWFT